MVLPGKSSNTQVRFPKNSSQGEAYGGGSLTPLQSRKWLLRKDAAVSFGQAVSVPRQAHR